MRGDTRIHKWKQDGLLYLALLKIAQQMVAGASRPNTLSRLVESIGRGAVQKASRSLEPTVAEGDMEEVGGVMRSRLEWSRAGTIFCTA